VNRWAKVLTATVAVFGLVVISQFAVPTRAADDDAGQKLFLDAKCNMCHAVPSANIEAKVKSEKMQGPAISGIKADAEMIQKFLRKETQIDGKDHKKLYEGSDEDLKTLVDWVLSRP
jgi:cytochrome c5